MRVNRKLIIIMLLAAAVVVLLVLLPLVRYILLFSLLFFVIIGLVIFFVPLRYKVWGAIDGKDSSVTVLLTWLLRLIYVRFSYTAGEPATQIQIAGRALKKSAQSKPAAKPQKVKKTNKAKNAATPEKKSLKEWLDTIIKPALTYPDTKIIMALCWEYFIRLIRNLRPQRLDIKGVFGFDDPSVTGAVLGAYEAAAGFYGFRRNIRLMGDFDKPTLRMEVDGKGRVSVFSLAGPLIWLISRKPVFNLILYLLKSRNKRNDNQRKEQMTHEQRKRKH